MITEPDSTSAPVATAPGEIEPSQLRHGLGLLHWVLMGAGWGLIGALFAFVVYFLGESETVPDEFGPLSPGHPFHDTAATVGVAVAIVLVGIHFVQCVRSCRDK